MNFRVLFAAEQETLDAARYYERNQSKLGRRFLSHVAAAYKEIQANPRLFPSHSLSDASTEVRQFLLPKFPFLVVYWIRESELLVVAVANTSKQPDYWSDRLKM